VQPSKPVANTVGQRRHETRVSSARTETVCGRREGSKELAARIPTIRGLEDCGIRGVEPEAVCGAAKDLEKAVELQRSAKQEDPNTESALGQAYVLSEKYQEALPL
jgi:hypothetical protein